VETELSEKPLRGNQTEDIHYSEDKASYKAVALENLYVVVVLWTLTHNPMRTPPNRVTYLTGSSIESFTIELLPKIDFNTGIATAHNGNSLRASGLAQQLLKYTL